MLYLKLVPNEFKNASHDKRELSVAEELGYKTLVVATTKENRNFQEFFDGYDVYRISTRRLGTTAWVGFLNRGFALLNFVVKTIQTDADIISGHNYIATFAAYIANCFKQRKAKIIYDSHEFELYQYAPGRKWIHQLIIKVIEGFLLRHVDLSLMVSDKIADGVQEIYGLHVRPEVVRNISCHWEMDLEKSEKIRKKFGEELNLPRDGIILMYHGAIMLERGIESVINALPFLPEDVGFVVMGCEAAHGTVGYFLEQARQCNVEKRVIFREAVPLQELKYYVGAADIEMLLIDGRKHRSFEYCLPNKFFESIQACVPVVSTNLPEIGKLVKKYDIGLLVKENDAQGVAEAVLKLREDKELYARLKRNMEKAKEDLCWEKESLTLKAAIQEMMGEQVNAM